MARFTVLLLAACVACALAVPTGVRNTCAQTCSDSSKFSYERGMSYSYDYEVETAVKETPYSEASSLVSVKAKATVGVVAPCEFVLSMSDVSLEGSADSEHFSAGLSGKPLRFAFDDGKISSLCAAEDEEEWVLNFKRGVLSTFQTTMRSLEVREEVHETDVTGECKTEYEPVSASADTKKIVRTKLSNNCNRTPAMSHTTLPKQLQNLPIIAADQHCDQTITAGVMTEAHCEDIITMREVNGETGTTSVVKTKLTLRAQSSGIASADLPNIRETTLMYNDAKLTEDNLQQYMKVENILSELDEKSSPVMTEEVPSLFTELIKGLKQLDARQMSHLYRSYKGSRTWRFLIDAAPLVSTAPSTILMTDLIKENHVTQDEADLWYTSLGFIQRPEAEMFAPLSDLLREINSKKAIIGASSLVKSYCQNKVNCIEEEGVQALISSLEEKLGSACRSTNSDEKDTIIFALSGLKTAGHVLKTEVIQNCFMDNNNPTDVRVSAIEVFKTLSCDYSKSPVSQIYSDSTYDSELRINAYLALMSCPTEDTIQMIKTKLTSESANQVCTFVWTHLSNVQESASRNKQWIRELIGEESLVNKFNSTNFKLSRNMETSFYMEELGLGSTVESNVIFGSDSYLPKSGMLNVSFDLFGESVNLFEIGGRFEGFETFAEKFFGPEGYYPQETVEALIRSMRQSKENEETVIRKLWGSTPHEPEGSYYMRLFGTDLYNNHFHGIENFLESSPKFDLNQFLAEIISSGQADYIKSIQMMDTELIYPTLSGFPLSLKINGVANVGFKVDGNFEFRGLSSMDLNGHLYPSAAVEIETSVLIDTHFSKSGLKKTFDGQTSATLDGSVKIEGGNVVDVTVNMPEEERIKLLTFKHKTVFVNNDVETDQSQDIDVTGRAACVPMIGADFCADHVESAAGFETNIYIHKTDIHNSYKLRFLRDETSVSFLVDTPNSRLDRKFALTAIKHGDEVKLDIYTPWKSLKGTALTIIDGQEPKLDLELLIDNTRRYQGGIQMRTSNFGSAIIYEPSLMLTSLGEIVLETSSRLEIDSIEKKASMKFESKGLVAISLEIEGSDSEGVKSAEIDIQSTIVTLAGKGKFETLNKICSELELEYAFFGRQREEIKYKIHHESSSVEIDTEILFHISQLPERNLHIKSNILNSASSILTKSSIAVGDNFFSMNGATEQNWFTEGNLKKYDYKLVLNSDTHDIDVSLAEKFEQRNNHILAESILQCGSTIYTNTKLEADYSHSEGFIRLDSASTEFVNFKKEISFSKISDRHYTAKTSAILNGLEMYDISAMVNAQTLGDKIDTEVSVNANVMSSPYSAHLKVETVDGELKAEGRATINTAEKFVKLSASPMSFGIETNIGIDLSLSGQAQLSGEERSVDVRGHWEQKPLHINVALTPASLEAQFRFADATKTMRIEVLQNGAKAVVNMSPSERYEAQVTYAFERSSYVRFLVQTPFDGFSKQELAVTFEPKPSNEFSSDVSLTWDNASAMSLQVTGKLDSTSNSSSKQLEVKMTNDLYDVGFKNARVLFNHDRYGLDISSSIAGFVDESEIVKGFVKSSLGNALKTVEMKLSSSVIDEISVTARAQGVESAEVKLSYGIKSMEAKYNLDVLSSVKVLNVSFYSPQITRASFTGKYESSETELQLEGDGEVFDKRYIASLSTENISTRNGYSVKGNARIIIPSISSPYRASWNLQKIGSDNYAIDMQMPRFWGTGDLKIHANTNYNDLLNINSLLTLVTPETRLSVNGLFKMETGRLTAYLKSSFNEHIFNIESTGQLGQDYTNNFRLSVIFDEETLLKLALENNNAGIRHTLKASVIINNSAEFVVSQILTFTDSFNWEYQIEFLTCLFKMELETDGNSFKHVLSFDNSIFPIYSDSRLNLNTQTAQINVRIPYIDTTNQEISAELQFKHEDFKLEIKTPFNILKNLDISAKIAPLLTEKSIVVSFTSNAVPFYASVALKTNKPDEFLSVEIRHITGVYNVIIGGEISNEIYQANILLNAPSTSLNEVEFEFSLDNLYKLTTSLKKEGQTLVSLKGELIGDSAQLELNSVFSGFERLRTDGSINRSKRSADLHFMSDASSAGISASFNFLSVKISTPYAAARESTFLLERKESGEIKLHYERNDNVIDFSAVPGPRRSFDITLRSAIPGWEFLALTGRLDQEQLLGYLSGQINEQKMTVEGSGKYSRRETNLRFDITTPYSGYEEITVEYHRQRNSFKINLTSSSDFHILIQHDRNTPYIIDVYIPNPSEPTIIKGSFSMHHAELEITSRFSFLRSFKYENTVDMAGRLLIKSSINYNGLEVFSFENEHRENRVTLDMHFRRAGHHSRVYFERFGLSSAELLFSRDGKEFKVNANLSGNLPMEGSVDFVINNSFRDVPRTISGSVRFDRRGANKTFNVQLTLPGNNNISVDAEYMINLNQPQTGEYTAQVSTPFGNNRISGSWDLLNHDDIKIDLTFGPVSASLAGKIHLDDSNFSLSSSSGTFETINFEWHFRQITDNYPVMAHDYFIKIGTTTRFVLGKFVASCSGLQNGEAEVTLQASRFMPDPLEVKINWTHDSVNGISARGRYTRGSIRGSFELTKLKRDAASRSLELQFSANTNIRGMRRISVSYEHSLNNRAMMKLDANLGRERFEFHFDLESVTSLVTLQTVHLTLPGYGDVDVNLGHDFSGRTRKFNITADILGRQSHFKAEWTRNENFSLMNGHIDIDFIDRIQIDGNYDFRNLNDVKAEIKYERGQRFFNLTLERKISPSDLHTLVNVDSNIINLPSAKLEVHGDFRNGFDLNVLLQRENRQITLKFNISQNSITGEITTPYSGFEKITGSLEYDITTRNRKNVSLKYARGDNQINMDITFTRVNNRRGSMVISLETPFDFARTLSIDAQWRNGRATVAYRRNNISFNLEGTANVRANRSSFELSVTPVSDQPIKISFGFNVRSMLRGNANQPQEIAKLDLEILGRRIAFELHGFRNAGKLYLDFKSESTFEEVPHIEFKLDSELNTEKREGLFEIKVDDFYFKVKNTFERKPNNGFYLRSEFDSTLTTLPGIIIGVGRENDSMILTIGSGDREITVTLSPKQDFTRGFSGTVSLPRLGVRDASFDVNYKFSSPNEIDVDINLQLEPGKTIAVDILYNSDGVQARLSSPFGSHHVRARRSIAANSFSAEAGLDDYNVSLRGDLLDAESKQGFRLEGEFFGKKMSVDSILQFDTTGYREGKLMFESNIAGYERFGGIFTYSNENGLLSAQTQVNLPSESVPQLILNLEHHQQANRAKIELDISGQKYALEGLYRDINGYEAELALRTPHTSFENLSLKGKLITDTIKTIDAVFEVEYPSGSLKLNSVLDVSQDILANLEIECVENRATSCDFKLHLEKLRGATLNSELSLKSIYLLNPLAMKLSSDSTKIEASAELLGETHLIVIEYDNSIHDLKITGILSSTLVEGRHVLNIEIKGGLGIFRPLTDEIEIKMSYSGLTTRSIVFLLDRTDAFKLSINLMIPGATYSVTGLLRMPIRNSEFSLIFQCPEGEQKIVGSLNYDTAIPQKKLINIHLLASLFILPSNFEYNMKGELENRKTSFEQTIKYNEILHHLKAGYSYTNNSADMTIEVETPILELNKVRISTEMYIAPTIKSNLVINLMGQSHTLEFEINKIEKRVLCIVKSPLLVGQLFKVDSYIAGESPRDADLIANLTFADQSYGMKFHLNLISLNDTSASLELKSPFNGYRKMNFLLSFKYDDNLQVTFKADKPVAVKFELFTGKKAQVYDFQVKIETPLNGYEKIMINAEFPLNETAVKMILRLPNSEYGIEFEFSDELYSKLLSGSVLVNGVKYGSGISFRYKAPYEFAFFYSHPQRENRFHIAMDSTMYDILYY